MSLSDYESIYKNLAIHISNAEEEESRADEHMKQALSVISELSNETNDSATSIAISLLGVVNMAYEATKSYWHKIYKVRMAVKSANDYVINNGGNLDDFVNAISWDGGCVPLSWALLCEDSGVDIQNWNICI